MDKSKERWKLAQASEKEWWKKQFDVIDFRYFKRFAENLTKEIEGVTSITSQTRILEIGSGPAGILTYLQSQNRYAIDPLEYYYGKQICCKDIRDPNVRYATGQGEFLPYTDNSFDFLIVDNILDHCEDIVAFFKEMKRVLVPGGIVYLRNFTHTAWGIFLCRILEMFKIDRGHPYNFREQDIVRLFETNRFRIVKKHKQGFIRHFFHLLNARRLSHFLRALSFSQGDKILFMVQNSK